MQVEEFTRLLALIATLTPEQCRQLRERLDDSLASEAIGAVIDGRLSQRPCCPKCGSQRVVRNGRANGLQRYKCRGCTATFNALSGAPLARLRHRRKWLAQARALDAGLSVRKAAKRGLSAEQVPIVMVHKRSGKTADSMLERADQRCLCAVLQPALAAAAIAMGIEHHCVNTARGERLRGPWHIQNVNAYHSRFKAWMARFLPRRRHLLPAQLPGLVPSPRPQCPDGGTTGISAGIGRGRMKSSSANANKAYSLCLPSWCGPGDGLAPAGEREVVALVDGDHHRLIQRPTR